MRRLQVFRTDILPKQSVGCINLEPVTQQHIKNSRLAIKKTLRNQYLKNWLETQNSSSATSREKFTHKEFKRNYQFEDYLLTTVKNPAHRISLTSLRLGCHALRIQTGKYENRGASIPGEERTCLVCKENYIEHEQHFLMYCQGYTTIRRELHSYISNMDAIYQSLSDNERTKYLLRVLVFDNENTCKIIGKYIHSMFTKRKEILNS